MFVYFLKTFPAAFITCSIIRKYDTRLQKQEKPEIFASQHTHIIKITKSDFPTEKYPTIAIFVHQHHNFTTR